MCLAYQGVENNSANKGVVKPIVKISDENFNSNSYHCVITGYKEIHQRDVELTCNSIVSDNGVINTYDNFPVTKDYDDMYTMYVKSFDKAGNSTEQEIVFSVNRFGSIYQFSQETDKCKNKYMQKEMDVVIIETNVDDIDNNSVEIRVSKNNNSNVLKKDIDYTVVPTKTKDNWKQNIYTIESSVFVSDAKYEVQIYSKDVAGNENSTIQPNKEAQLIFGIDKTTPHINANNVESNKTYPVDEMYANINISDNLVLEDVSIKYNGEITDVYNIGEQYEFELENSNSAQNIEIVAKDAAGNESIEKLENFYVTTNLFIRWKNNIPLVIATFVVIVIVSGFISYLLLVKGKKQKK